MGSDKVDCESGIQCSSQHDNSRQRHHLTILAVILGVGFVGLLAATSSSFQTKRESENSIRKLVGEEDSESSNAPLFLQRIDNINLLNKFMLKYGLDGGDTVENYEALETSDEKGWAYISIYSNDTCSGPDISTGGVVTEQCFSYYDEDDPSVAATSMKFQCSNGHIMINEYEDNDCGVLSMSRSIVAEGCNQLNSTWNFDPNNMFYGEIKCSTGPEYPIYGNYNLFRGYIIDTPDTCEGLALFEANSLGNCVPLSWQEKEHSVVFDITDDGDPYATLYTESESCTGVNVNMDLHSQCTGISFNSEYTNSSDVSYNWEYYIPTEDKTLHPSLSPTAGAITPTLEPTLEPSAEPSEAPVEEATESPTMAPSEEMPPLSKKTDNPTRSFFKTDNPTPGHPVTSNPTPTVVNPSSSPNGFPFSYNPTPVLQNPSEAPVQVKVEEDVVKIDPNIIVKPYGE